MAKPQQPELARSDTDLDPDRIGSELEARQPVPSGGPTGPVPPDNLRGHHPPRDQDKPDLAAFVAKFQGENRPAPEETSRPPRREEVIDLDAVTKQDLYQRARELDIAGRSKMDKAELADAISGAAS